MDDIKISSNRSFGIVFFVVFLLIALYPLTYGGEIRIWSLIISIIFFFTNNFVINFMSDIDEIRKLSSSYVIWLIILPVISSFCYQFDGIFIGASQTKELRNAMIFSVLVYLLISILAYFDKYQNV